MTKHKLVPPEPERWEEIKTDVIDTSPKKPEVEIEINSTIDSSMEVKKKKRGDSRNKKNDEDEENMNLTPLLRKRARIAAENSKITSS